MKKIFAMLALGFVLMSSAFAIPNIMKYVYPEYTGKTSDPGVVILEVQDDVTFININGVNYVIKK